MFENSMKSHLCIRLPATKANLTINAAHIELFMNVHEMDKDK